MKAGAIPDIVNPLALSQLSSLRFFRAVSALCPLGRVLAIILFTGLHACAILSPIAWKVVIVLYMALGP
jgi:hypothetical protein